VFILRRKDTPVWQDALWLLAALIAMIYVMYRLNFTP
jgi:hypothetical protein